MHNDAILDELRQVERDVAEGERRLAEQEALLVSLKRQNHEHREAQTMLNMLRDQQRQRDQDRQRLLSLLQP